MLGEKPLHFTAPVLQAGARLSHRRLWRKALPMMKEAYA
jgi:hypothetical protein